MTPAGNTPDLAEILTKFIPDGQQKPVAMEWLARWSKESKQNLSPATVESRFSDLLKERLDGVRFFYNNSAREALLAEILHLPQDVREQARVRAAGLIAEGGVQSPRLVLNLCGISRDAAQADAIFKALKQDILTESPILPLVMLVDEDQYDRLPRSFDDYGERLRYVKVNQAQAQAQAEEIAGQSAIVVSSQRFQPEQRWLAIRWDGGRLQYGPEDGLTQIRAKGCLDAPAVAVHDLKDIIDEEPLPGKFELPKDSVALRRAICTLGDEARCSSLGDIAWRLALSRALGLKASSTAEEREAAAKRRERARIEAELAEVVKAIGLEAKNATPEELEQALTRASRLPVDPVILRVGDTVHLVGNEGLKAPTRERLNVHRVEVKPTALQRLLQEVDVMTEDAWRDDPLLLGVIGRLARGSAEERRLLLHARAGLVISGALKPATPEPVEEWREALRGLLEGEPPAALLKVDVEAEPMWWIERKVALKPWAYPDGKMFLPEVESTPQMYFVPPLACPYVQRGERLCIFHPVWGYSSEPRRWRQEWENVPDVLVPTDPHNARDPELWLSLVDGSPAFGGSKEAVGEQWSRFDKVALPGELPEWRDVEYDLDPLWPEADSELAMAWLALRRAARQGEGVRLHDGLVLLEIGGGILASIRMRRHGAADAPTRAALTLLVAKVEMAGNTVRANLQDLKATLDTIGARTLYGSRVFTTHAGFALPRGIRLLGRGVALDISFVASPLLAAGTTPNGVPLSSIMASAAGASAIATLDSDDD